MVNELQDSPGRRHLKRWRRHWGDLGQAVYPIPGNHDYDRGGSLDTWWKDGASQLGTKAVWFERRSFALGLPTMRVFGVDSGPTGRRIDPSQLDGLLAIAGGMPSVPWTIIAVHAPVSPVSVHMNAPMTRASVDAITEFSSAVDADLLISGHEHVYARQDGRQVPARAQVIVGGGGAEPYPIIRTGLRAQATGRHFLIVEATSRRLEGRAYGADGECFDAWAWDRARSR